MNIITIKISDVITRKSIPFAHNYLFMRTNGIKIKNEIIETVKSYLIDHPHIVLNLDFTDIISMDSSCADEIVFKTKLYFIHNSNVQIIYVLSGFESLISDDTFDAIKAAQLVAEDIQKEKKETPKSLPVLYLNEGKLIILGKIEDKLQSIYDSTITPQGTTTRDISINQEISLKNAGMQATKLLNLGLIFKYTECGPNGNYSIYKKLPPHILG